MKVCSLYGEGFYYIPGSDICLKLGGYARFQTYYGGGIQPGFGPWGGQAQVQQTRLFNSSNDLVYRTRAIATIDTRQQTEYGTVRTYWLLGFTAENNALTGLATNAPAGSPAPAVALYATRGFIQFAGFTVGKATSFFDFYSIAAISYSVQIIGSDTGDGGQVVAAYTADYGNGWSSTVSLEDPRKLHVVNTDVTNPFIVGNNPTADTGNIRAPDIVWNWRVDQAWGAAQVMFAAHDASGGYYAASPAAPAGSACVGLAGGGVLTGSANCGHPADKLGWAAGAGARFNVPASTSYFQVQGMYTEGASRYVSNTTPNAGSIAKFGPNVGGGDNTLGVGWWTDGVFSTLTGDVRLTTAWGINAGYDHAWTPTFRTSLYGAYGEWRHDDAAKLSICASMRVAAPGVLSRPSNCDPNFSVWSIGSRTQWNFTRLWYVGFETEYSRLNSAFKGDATFTAATGLPQPTARYRIEDKDWLRFTVRFHRDFYP